MIYYVKGWHNIKRDIGLSSKHIKIHLTDGNEGQITIEELLNLGNFIREYLKIFKEPFLEDQNKEGIGFRVVADKIKGEGLIPPLSPFDKIIITFYFDKNLND